MLPLRDRLPTRRAPVVTYLLIFANVLVYAATRFAILSGADSSALVRELGLVPARFWAAPVVEVPHIISSMFMHDPSGLLHLGGNMLFLWIFGDNVEDALGRARFLGFYLLCGVGAALAQVLIDPSATVPMVGASGAISGVLAAYGSLYPRSPITVLNPVPLLWIAFGLTFELPSWLVILEYFVMNLLSGFGALGGTGSGIAFFAHLGGFIVGILAVRLFIDERFVYRPRRAVRRPRRPAGRVGWGGPWDRPGY